MPKVGYMVKAREIGYSGTGRYVWTACSDCGKGEHTRLHHKLGWRKV